ncbi:hypothetical protein GW17_00023081 [Ensete ventricosum]|nr:hypothetical protein GW17_00023081 [Ensete ventricosum]RZS24270.1 hypothetical protein BHM03_00057320 [Ensete ventricosum]
MSNPSIASASAVSIAASTAYERVRRCSFHTHFPPSLLLSCVAPSTIEGEDRSFLHHRWTHLKLPLPTMSPSVASVVVVAVATAVQSFLRCYCCRPQLTLPLLSSVASSAAIAIICNFFHCCRHRRGRERTAGRGGGHLRQAVDLKPRLDHVQRADEGRRDRPCIHRQRIPPAACRSRKQERVRETTTPRTTARIEKSQGRLTCGGAGEGVAEDLPGGLAVGSPGHPLHSFLFPPPSPPHFKGFILLMRKERGSLPPRAAPQSHLLIIGRKVGHRWVPLKLSRTGSEKVFSMLKRAP